jgi:hypothetical protein
MFRYLTSNNIKSSYITAVRFKFEGSPCRNVYNSVDAFSLIIVSIYTLRPVKVAAQSKAWTIFARSDAGIVGSNPTQGMDVCCVYAFILCLGSGLATDWLLVQEVLSSVKNDYGTE